MPRVESTPEGALTAIISQIGAFVRDMVIQGTGADAFPHLGAAIRTAVQMEGISAGMTTGAVEVTETFPLWVMHPEQGMTGSADLRRLAHPTDRWHHQIKLAGGRWAYIRSRPAGGDVTAPNWQIEELFEGPLAERVAAAIDLLDHSFPDDYVVRLLSIPAYVMNVFWIVCEETGDQKVVLLTPPEFALRQGEQTIEEAGDFLQRLRGRPVVGGLLGDVPSRPTGVVETKPTQVAGVEVEIRVRCSGNIRRRGRS